MGRIELNNVVIGGYPVAFEGDGDITTVELSGTTFDAAQWHRVKERIDKVFVRAGLGPVKDEQAKPRKGSVPSNFFSANHIAIGGMSRGVLQPVPWWLRWKYDAVVTKEEFREYD